MGVSKNLVEILNRQYNYNIEKVSDVFISKSTAVEYSNLSMENEIKRAKEKLIRFSDHDGDEEIINLLMHLEINQKDHLEKEQYLNNKIKKLEDFIEKLIDNSNVDLRDFNTIPLLPVSTGNQDYRIDDESWIKASKSRDRGLRLKGILEKNKVDTSDKH